ncbi:unnamed protein product [Phytomonas sp. Hart1]|nr:unnamed protein product [Phytomonas sp. Hart1]|eukprot:CCW67895.1 unnamed protein product [Phytomonas sp. isolate Hart1]
MFKGNRRGGGGSGSSPGRFAQIPIFRFDDNPFLFFTALHFLREQRMKDRRAGVVFRLHQGIDVNHLNLLFLRLFLYTWFGFTFPIFRFQLSYRPPSFGIRQLRIVIEGAIWRGFLRGRNPFSLLCPSILENSLRDLAAMTFFLPRAKGLGVSVVRIPHSPRADVRP